MRLLLNDRIEASATVAMVGAWDLVTAQHAEALTQLTLRARCEGWSAAVVLIEPNPSAFLHGVRSWITFEPVASRVARLRRCGVDYVGILDFTEADLAAGAADFLDAVVEPLGLRELWIGARQSLGTGPAGSVSAIREETARRSVDLVRLPEFDGTRVVKVARAKIISAELAACVCHSGVAPMWTPGRDGTTPTAWPEGSYRAICVAGDGYHRVRDVEVVVTPAEGGNYLVWPSGGEDCFVFYSGPRDEPAASATARSIASLQAWDLRSLSV